MTLQALVSIAIRLDGQVIKYEPGAVFNVTDAQATRLLERAPGKLQAIALPLDRPIEPLQEGWLVVYRDRAGRLAGGCDDRVNGTVAACTRDGGRWSVRLTNGQSIPLTLVRSVVKTDPSGQVLAAWTVREHDYDGEGGRG
jgi:hypothetical protein